jgi:hypothetical protein
MIEPSDVAELLNLCDAVDRLARDPSDPLLGHAVIKVWKRLHGTEGNAPQCPIPPAIARELITVWLRVAAKHEQMAIQPSTFAPEVRELVECMLFGAPAIVTPIELAAAARMVSEQANDDRPPAPFIRCLCGADFLPEAPHCPMCGRFVQ